ncbi:MAG: alpha/beta fold hydrolase [Bacteroidota bacterium]
MSALQYVTIDNFKLSNGESLSVRLSYQTFGKPLHEAPIVLVNHALTGNSNVSGDDGWWNDVIGDDKVIDTKRFTILAFNIPGNGYGDEAGSPFKNYNSIKAVDIAGLFSKAIDLLGIQHLYACIGGSVGGGLAWELAALRPNLIQHLIPVACDWKATDWLIANCYIQDQILNHSEHPIQDARIHAMTFYRTPESFTDKFNRTKREADTFNVESWLAHHGEKLKNRFQLSAYKLLNHILKTVDITDDDVSFLEVTKAITSDIHIITINSDLFFKPEENWKTYVDLKSVKDNVTIGEIKSIHGHDAFLIEYQQLTKLLKPVFKSKPVEHDNHKSSYIRHW